MTKLLVFLGGIRGRDSGWILFFLCGAMDKFFAEVQQSPSTKTAASLKEGVGEGEEKKELPKGVVLGKDGKPYVFFEVSFFRGCSQVFLELVCFF